jgi:uncharacterized protein
MKLLKNIFLFLFVFAYSTTIGQSIPDRPNPPKLVNDKLGLLTTDQQQALEQKLVNFDKTTSTQIAIVTTDDIAGMDAGDYAVELGNKWGVGGVKTFNNGVVFLIYRSKDNAKRKVFIASGKGLEDVLPDYTCSEIVNNEVIPKLRGGDYYHAIDNGTTAIINATQGKYVAPKNYGKQKSPSLFTILLVIVIIVIILSSIGKGGGGSYMSRRGYRGYNGPTIWWTGGGGGWGGGGSGSSGGGGFGGFGGGSFGGGGAGGDW